MATRTVTLYNAQTLTEVAEAEDATGAERRSLRLLKAAHDPAYTANGIAPQKYPAAAIPIAMISCINCDVYTGHVYYQQSSSGNTQHTTDYQSEQACSQGNSGDSIEPPPFAAATPT